MYLESVLVISVNYGFGGSVMTMSLMPHYQLRVITSP